MVPQTMAIRQAEEALVRRREMAKRKSHTMSLKRSEYVSDPHAIVLTSAQEYVARHEPEGMQDDFFQRLQVECRHTMRLYAGIRGQDSLLIKLRLLLSPLTDHMDRSAPVSSYFSTGRPNKNAAMY